MLSRCSTNPRSLHPSHTLGCGACNSDTTVKCTVPGILIAVLFSDVPVAETLYMAKTVLFPLALAPMVKSAI